MRRYRLIVAAFTPSFLALAVLAACSTDSGSGSNASSSGMPTVDGGGGKDVNPGDTSTPPMPEAGPPVDAGSDCGKAAALHPPKPNGGVFCPFSAPPGGKNVFCAETEQCCQNAKGTGVSTCAPKGGACPIANATIWECEDKSDCPSGQKCCAHGGDAGTVTVATDSCGPYLSKFNGTTCAAICPAGDLVVCEAQADCAGSTCTAVKPKGNDVGVCK